MATRRVRGGIDGLNAALRGWPKHANKELRDEAGKVAQKVADHAKSIGAGEAGVIRKVAPTLRPRRDRYPALVMGNKSRWRKGQNQHATAVVYGAEFGSVTFPHLREWRGNGDNAGYAIYPAARDLEDEVKQDYADAIQTALERSL